MDSSSRLETFAAAARDRRLEASLRIANGIDAYLLGLTPHPGRSPAAEPRRGGAASGAVECLPYATPEEVML